MGVTTAWEEGLRTRLLTLCLAASPGRRVLGRGRGSPLGVSGILRYLRLTEGLSLGPLLAWRSSDVFYTGLSTRLLHTAQMDRGIYDFARSSGVLYQRAVERPGSSLAFGVTEGRRAALRLLLEGGEELGVVVRAGEAIEQALRGLGGVGRVGGEHGGHAPDEPDVAQRLRVEEQLLAAGAAAGDVDGGEDAPLGEAAVEVQLHVAGALELLVDDLVHAAAGVDEAGGDDREAGAPAPGWGGGGGGA